MWATKHPQYAIGVHLTTTSEWEACKWGPVAHENTSTLRDEEGYMWNECDKFENNADLDQIRDECLAQLNLAKKLGLNPSHWDNHMGSLYGIATGRLEILEQTLAMSAEQDLPFRFPLLGLEQEHSSRDIPIDMDTLKFVFRQIQGFVKERGVACPDFLMPPEHDADNTRDYNSLRDYMFEFVKTFPHGITETFIHPCTDTGEITAASHLGNLRVWEYQIYLDPKFQQHLKDIGIQKINYRDLKKMRGL